MSDRTAMRSYHTTLLALPLHGFQLTGLLFLEYLSGATFRGDIAEAVCNFSAILPLIRGRSMKNIQSLIMMYASMLRDRFILRAAECAISAACVYGNTFTKDAVVFHYLMPLVQEYRFSRFFLTRALRGIGRFLYPGFLRRLVFGASADPEVNPDIAYVQNPPRPVKDEDVYATMPDGVKDALQFYNGHYHAHPFYAAAASCFVQESARLALEGAMWASRLAREKENPDVSKWRLLKPFLAYATRTGAELALTIFTRGVVAAIAGHFSSDPTGGTIFWSERILYLLNAPAIAILSSFLSAVVYETLEKKHPTTPEDLAADEKDKKEQEEETRNSGFYFFEAASASASGSPEDRERFKKGVDFYMVLGVEEKAQGAEIKKAYRQLALKNHPDRVGSDALAQKNARENMAIINEAYDVLINESTRMQYDASRMFADSPDFLKYMEKLSVSQFVCIGAGAAIGLFLAAGVGVYAQYCTLFQSVTALGRAPLDLFEFELPTGDSS